VKAKNALLLGGRSRSKAVSDELRQAFLVSSAGYAPSLTTWGQQVQRRLLTDGREQ